MRQCGRWGVLVCVLFGVAATGCYRVKKWDVAEGREAIYTEDPSKEKVKSAHPIRGVIKVKLAAPKHMACVLKSIDGTEGFDGEKVCEMVPITGQDLTDEWKKMYATAEGHKIKAGYIAMNVGEVLQSELKASLEQYFFAADVKLDDSSPKMPPKTMVVGTESTKDELEMVSPDNHRAIAALNAAEQQADEKGEPTFAHQAGVHIPFTINSVPVFLYVPTTSEERINPEDFADAIRVTAADLAKKLVEYQDEAARSARTHKKPSSISVMF